MLIIPQSVTDAMLAHAEQGYPHEVCGLLLGNFSDGMKVRTVREGHVASNLNTERAQDRYDLDPAAYQRIERDGAKRGLEIVGIYHTHPDHPARPSETDRQRAVEIWGPGESWSYVIIAVAQGKVATWTSWILNNEQFHSEDIEAVK